MHVKAARSVVSLNTGFEAQLKCLEAVDGDVWRAQQLYLHQNMNSLAKQFADGTITMTSHAKRYQAQQQNNLKEREIFEPPMTPPLNGSRSRIVAPDRGCMIIGQVPNGFNLSTVSAVNRLHFIPALRSMGTMFGCMKCDHHLFCASSIVLHQYEALENENSQMESHQDAIKNEVQQSEIKSIPRSSTMPLSAGDESVTETLAPNHDDGKKRPLLAKLRLRPQSFRSSSSGLSAMIGSNPNAQRDQDRTRSDIALPSPRPIIVPATRDGILKSPTKATITAAVSGHQNMRSASPRHRARRVSDFLRSLTPFKSPRHLFKAAIENPTQPHSKHLSSENKKLTSSKTAVVLEPYVADSHEHNLNENAAEWERCIRAILVSGDDDTELIEQIQTVIDADLEMMAKWKCGQWNIEPQNWFFGEILKSSSGILRCPNDSCGTIVGEWSWDGTRYIIFCVILMKAPLNSACFLRCSCGQPCQPGFLVNHSAVKILGVSLQAS